MSDPMRWTGQAPATRQQQQPASNDGTNLADILERVLDKGIVIAGDVQINLLDIELLTIKLRLVVASVDRAKEMGIDWWERDPTLSSGHRELEDENRRLRERLEALESGGTPRALPADDQDGAEDEAEDGELADDVVDDDGDEPEEDDVEDADEVVLDEDDDAGEPDDEVAEEPEPDPPKRSSSRARAARPAKKRTSS